ncbi:CaiB/BaiF CoA-transferase family protein [Pigmentiphaga soli]|uniref:CaiB/BaiF CoA-transferase family protein n=1 Tax=Pigmentiphaga soli TaxID=1007095 RepID=A0ABP8GE36_9BURK
MAGALSHIRVLDLTRVLAGPWATQTLADLGADVIKVERPVAGDDTRHWGPPWVADGEGRPTSDSAYFTSTNRNKRSITVDLSRPEGQALVRELAAGADVLVENFKVGDLARHGLGYEDLRALNPRLVYCSVTGYGQTGPYANRPGYDYVFQGEGGLMGITGEREDLPGGGPMKVGIAVTDVLTGLYAAIGILAALEARNVTGLGQHIDMGLLDTIVAFGSNQIANYFATGVPPGLVGNAHPNLAPYQPFRTADGRIIVACANDGQYKRLCQVLDRADLADDPRYQTMGGRSQNRAALCAQIERTMREHPTSYWAGRLIEAGIPSGPINNYKQVFEHPQVIHRGMKVDLPHAGGGVTSVVASPLRLSDTPVEYRLAPPTLGQHTAEILQQVLGKSSEEIERLARKRVI